MEHTLLSTTGVIHRTPTAIYHTGDAWHTHCSLTERIHVIPTAVYPEVLMAQPLLYTTKGSHGTHTVVYNRGDSFQNHYYLPQRNSWHTHCSLPQIELMANSLLSTT